MYGIGYNSKGDYKKSKGGIHKTVYTCWKGMFERCYNTKTQELYPSYKGCSVDEEWFDFQNFAKWFDINYVDGWCLDKDLLVKGNKIYSSNNCCFIPNEINVVFTSSRVKRGDLPIGVTTRGKKFKSQIKKVGKVFSLGYFNTPEEAFQAYKTSKKDYINELAEKWKSQISEKAYKALIKYQVEITD